MTLFAGRRGDQCLIFMDQGGSPGGGGSKFTSTESTKEQDLDILVHIAYLSSEDYQEPACRRCNRTVSPSFSCTHTHTHASTHTHTHTHTHTPTEREREREAQMKAQSKLWALVQLFANALSHSSSYLVGK